MTGFEHSLIATGLLAIFYYAGRYFGRRESVEDAIVATFEALEDNGYISTIENANGEKELQPFPKKPLT